MAAASEQKRKRETHVPLVKDPRVTDPEAGGGDEEPKPKMTLEELRTSWAAERKRKRDERIRVREERVAKRNKEKKERKQARDELKVRWAQARAGYDKKLQSWLEKNAAKTFELGRQLNVDKLCADWNPKFRPSTLPAICEAEPEKQTLVDVKDLDLKTDANKSTATGNQQTQDKLVTYENQVMRGFKLASRDGSCTSLSLKRIQFKVGEEYKTDEIALSRSGFHFSLAAVQCLRYTNQWKPPFVLFEVEASGRIQGKPKHDMYCTSHLRIVRQVPELEAQKLLSGTISIENRLETYQSGKLHDQKHQAAKIHLLTGGYERYENGKRLKTTTQEPQTVFRSPLHDAVCWDEFMWKFCWAKLKQNLPQNWSKWDATQVVFFSQSFQEAQANRARQTPVVLEWVNLVLSIEQLEEGVPHCVHFSPTGTILAAY